MRRVAVLLMVAALSVLLCSSGDARLRARRCCPAPAVICSPTDAVPSITILYPRPFDADMPATTVPGMGFFYAWGTRTDVFVTRAEIWLGRTLIHSTGAIMFPSATTWGVNFNLALDADKDYDLKVFGFIPFEPELVETVKFRVAGAHVRKKK